MWVGDVVADRFVIERPIGSGGMGSVFLAADRVEGRPVAVKVLDLASEGAVERFGREARTLADLSHPGIVRYVAHGETKDRQPFLAMELLEGEDLATRLGRAGLSPEESVAVIRRAAEALAFAHGKGVVHRDVKPSNLFLVDGSIDRLKVLDFGIARANAHTAGLTQTGAMLGTVGYMAPEQAMGSRDADARADVFALGCVLFECLTGRPAFAGEHVVAILAKVLTEEAPRVSELRHGLGDALDTLVAAMLAKKPEERPVNAAAVLGALDGLSARTGSPRVEETQSSAALTRAEQKIVSAILAEPAADLVSSATVTPDESNRDMERLQAVAAGFSAELTALQGGALLLVLSGKGAASDLAARAASCALEVNRLRPDLRIALATGSAETTTRLPVGPAIDRAAALLRAAVPKAEVTVLIDHVTASLLGERFELRPEAAGVALIRRRLDVEPPRILLGKPTPCVGRDKELALLDATLSECIDESVARAVLVTGPPGQGKSRLRHEFVGTARARGDVAVLTARADPASAGSSFTLVRQIVREAVGLREGEPELEQHGKLRAQVAEFCRGSDFARIADFLGELIGIPSVDRPSPELRSARDDSRVMGVWLERSFQEWLAAQCADRPLLVVLEDLHWGDLPSLTYVGSALRALAAKPIMVLALARPEVHEAFPNLWAFAEKNEVSLGRLPPRAAERLVRAALGESVTLDTVSRIVERADGNAFYLEELIRRVAEGEGDTLPETVVALLQSRLERLEPEDRRVLRAASIFGGAFWRGGVARLLGVTSTLADLDTCLNALTERELLTAVQDSQFPGDHEFAFRHDLIREAAYAMLTEADRSTGHRLAGEWLEAVGEKDPLMLAEHFEKGGEAKRAVRWFVGAADAAVDGGNFQAALVLCRRGFACEPDPAERGLLGAAQATSLAVVGEPREAAKACLRTMEFAEVGSAAWFLGAGGAFFWGAFLGDLSITVPVLQAILAVEILPEPSGPYGHAVWITCAGLTVVGQYDLARSFLTRVETASESTSDPDMAFRSFMYTANAHSKFTDGEFGVALAAVSAAQSLADRAGHAVARLHAGHVVTQVLSWTGNVELTERALAELLSSWGGQSASEVSAWGTHHLNFAKVLTGRAHDAIEPLSALLSRQDRLLSTTARTSLAAALVQCGDLPGAEREARRSLEEGSGFPSVEKPALGVLAAIEIRRGDPTSALTLADRGIDGWLVSLFTLPLWLARAEALKALGRAEDAHAAIREARDVVLRVAATLADHPDRSAGVQPGPDHAASAAYAARTSSARCLAREEP